jgi:putative ABC transport system permease protein
MTPVLAYLSIYAQRCAGRMVLTTLGLALSFGAVAYAYGVAIRLDEASTRVLREIVGGGKLWVVPAGGVVADPQTGGILPVGALDPEAMTTLRAAGGAMRWAAVRAEKVMLAGAPAVVYADERLSGPGLVVGPRQGAGGVSVEPGSTLDVNGTRLPVRLVREDLPPGIAFTALDIESESLGSSGGVSWLISASESSDELAPNLAHDSRFEFRSTPSGATSPNARALVVATSASGARFDPYTFRTRFSALVVNRALVKSFGWAARFVFGLGLLLTVSSSLVGVAERRDELAWFTVKGFLPSFTLLLLVESTLLGFLSFVLGTALALVLLALRVTSDAGWSFVLSGAIASSAAYAPLVILLGALVPAQSAASRSPGEVMRTSS